MLERTFIPVEIYLVSVDPILSPVKIILYLNLSSSFTYLATPFLTQGYSRSEVILGVMVVVVFCLFRIKMNSYFSISNPNMKFVF